MNKNKTALIFILFIIQYSFSQNQNTKDWTENEKNNYNTLKNLAEYVSKTDPLDISKDTLFNKYIYFDNILKDTLAERKQSRLKKFDYFFKFIPKAIDSLGIENIDAKPIRFYKENKIFEPFEKALSGMEKDVFVYYLKTKPEEPLGTLLFEPDSSKLLTWILLKQGSSGWFWLTFNKM